MFTVQKVTTEQLEIISLKEAPKKTLNIVPIPNNIT